MAKPAIYLLRSTTEGVAYYLSNVSPNGCHVEFDRRLDHGWRFTEQERAKLTVDHGHIRGRWVLLDREEKRRTLAEASTQSTSAASTDTGSAEC